MTIVLGKSALVDGILEKMKCIRRESCSIGYVI